MADAVAVDLRRRPNEPGSVTPARVALVQCPAWGALPPLGPAALKGHLLEYGHEVRCFDFNIDFYNQEQRRHEMAEGGAAYGDEDPWGAHAYDQWAIDYDRGIGFQPGSRYAEHKLPIEAWADELLAFEPDVIGFSIYITSLASSLELAELIQYRAPSVTIVFGGPNVSRDKDGELALWTAIPQFVIDGEGEGALIDLIEAVQTGSDLDQVQGIGRMVAGFPVWNEPHPQIRKIDTLPYPDFSDYDWDAYPNPFLIPIMASRGCVLDCAFCYETVYWRRFRTQGPQRIVDEIEHQVSTHPLRDRASGEDRFYFMFADSLVNGHPAGLRRMSQQLIDRQIEIGWGGQATINTKMDKAYFEVLAESGCTGLAFGLESGSQRVLDRMGKHFKIEDAEDFVKQVHEAGVTVTVNVMVGFPTETRRDFLQTLRFLYRTRKWIYQVSNVTTTQIASGSQLDQAPNDYDVTVHLDGSWTSPQTGTEASRRRRLKALHWWMKLCRINHQNIAEH